MIVVAFILFILLFCISSIFIIIYFVTKRKIFIKLFVGYWLTLVLLFLSLLIVGLVNSPTSVDKDDLYGEYVIDKNMFKGKNADWQSEHFSFEIKENDEFVFFEYYDNGIVKSKHTGNVEFVEGYASPHLRLSQVNPEHQIFDSEPLLVRNNWNFYYVFKSKKFGNVFFKKK